MAFTQQKWTMDRLINPLTRKISLTSLKTGSTDTQQTLSPRKPVKADHSILNSTNTYNSGIRRNGYSKSSVLNLPNRPSYHDKTNFSSGGSSQLSKRTNESKKTDKYERPLTPRSQGEALLRSSKLKLMKLNEGHKTSTKRFTQPEPITSSRQQPSSLRRADSNPVIVPSSKPSPRRSTSFNSGNLPRSRSSSISQVDANVPLPGIPRTRRNSFDSSSLVGSRPASRNSSTNIEQQKNFMSGRSLVRFSFITVSIIFI